jgi:hypothetical protein
LTGDPRTVRAVLTDGTLIEFEPDAEVVPLRSGGFGAYGDERRLSNGHAIARLEARQDELRAKRDQMVSDHPDLKSLPVRPHPPDDDAA